MSKNNMAIVIVLIAVAIAAVILTQKKADSDSSSEMKAVWSISQWSKCGSDCTQTREVLCKKGDETVEDRMCVTDAKPVSTQECTTDDCYGTWYPTYGDCKEDGYRPVTWVCQNQPRCKESEKGADTEPCYHVWDWDPAPGSYTECDETCTQTAKRNCKDHMGNPAADSRCPYSEYPASRACHEGGCRSVKAQLVSDVNDVYIKTTDNKYLMFIAGRGGTPYFEFKEPLPPSSVTRWTIATVLDGSVHRKVLVHKVSEDERYVVALNSDNVLGLKPWDDTQGWESLVIYITFDVNKVKIGGKYITADLRTIPDPENAVETANSVTPIATPDEQIEWVTPRSGEGTRFGDVYICGAKNVLDLGYEVRDTDHRLGVTDDRNEYCLMNFRGHTFPVKRYYVLKTPNPTWTQGEAQQGDRWGVCRTSPLGQEGYMGYGGTDLGCWFTDEQGEEKSNPVNSSYFLDGVIPDLDSRKLKYPYLEQNKFDIGERRYMIAHQSEDGCLERKDSDETRLEYRRCDALNPRQQWYKRPTNHGTFHLHSDNRCITWPHESKPCGRKVRNKSKVTAETARTDCAEFVEDDTLDSSKHGGSWKMIDSKSTWGEHDPGVCDKDHYYKWILDVNNPKVFDKNHDDNSITARIRDDDNYHRLLGIVDNPVFAEKKVEEFKDAFYTTNTSKAKAVLREIWDQKMNYKKLM